MPHHFHGFMLFGALVPSLLGLIIMIFWIWMLVDCVRNPRLSGGAKIAWLLVVFFLSWVGALIYFFLGRMRNRATFIHSRSQSYARPYQQPDRPPLYNQPSQPIYYQPTPSPANETYRAYQEGYEVVPAQRQAEETANWQHYEEPQSSYPQLPQQELPPQGQR